MKEETEYIERKISELMANLEVFWEAHTKEYGLSRDCLLIILKELKFIRRIINEIRMYHGNGERRK